MNTTIDFLYNYLYQVYGLDFDLIDYGTFKCLKFQKGEKEYLLHYDYARQPQIDSSAKEYWSLFTSYMNHREWYGNGGAYIDEGTVTIDKVMNEWGFQKQNQTTIFDFIRSDD